ncbi:MAG: hypothetical protein EXR72_09180 [Myxococcales bacterium]|nr:hypothetical protein [Myxococcales bacterium]
MRRLGDCEQEAHAERLAELMALPISERLRRSIALSQRFWKSANRELRVDDLIDIRNLMAIPSLDWAYLQRWARDWEVEDRLARMRALDPVET